MSQQRQADIVERRKIADEITDRQLGFTIKALTADAFVNPGAVTLAIASVYVGIKPTNNLTSGIFDSEVASVLMPDSDTALLDQRNVVESCR